MIILHGGRVLSFFLFFLGLSLELNIERDEYMGKLSNEMGVQILISDQGSNNFPLEEGMSVPAGASVKIGMKKASERSVTLVPLQIISSETCGCSVFHKTEQENKFLNCRVLNSRGWGRRIPYEKVWDARRAA